jgi:DNA-directed RNA polymerase specialized sigma24 family protein
MTTMLEEDGTRAEASADRRAGVELLLRRAEHLPETPRTILTAYLAHGMAISELAVLHKTTARQMRRRVERLQAGLGESCFLLAARYGDQLPRNLRGLVRAHWLEGYSMRELATVRRVSLHRIRHLIGVARSMLLVALSAESPRGRSQAQEALCLKDEE